jgi:transglutaminase-like putative cysteine protease
MRVRALPLLATLLAALAVLLAARLPGAEPAFPAGFAVALLWRLGLGLDGRGLVPRKLGALLLGGLLAAALPFLFAHASSTDPHSFFLALIGTLTCFLGLVLLLPLSAFGAFWLVLLATTLVAVTCSLDGELLGALLVPLYVALLALTLIVLERAASAVGPEREPTATRVVLRDAGSPLGRALSVGGLRLVAWGLALGLSLWVLAPRPGRGGSEGAATRAADSGSAGANSRDVERGGEGALTGPDAGTHDALLGAVERIQEDKRVHWEVRLLEGAPDPPILLREGVRDLWLDTPNQAAPRWRSSQGDERRGLVPGADGWVELDEPVHGRATRLLEAQARLGLGLVVLEPEPLAFRVERPTGEDLSGPRTSLIDVTELLGSGRLRRQVLPGDVLLMRSQPQLREGSLLRGRESSGRVAPLSVYARIDLRQRERLLELTRAVPGVGAGDAWARAQALERWLQGPDFVYELMSPKLKPGQRVEDFLTRVKRGNCEWYATALTLLLRAHGMASRYVQGYWGGSHTQGSNLWTFYGADFHAWTEIYLDGLGWVPLNPTPPERLPEGADRRTGEVGRAADGSEGPRPRPHAGQLAALGTSILGR